MKKIKPLLALLSIWVSGNCDRASDTYKWIEHPAVQWSFSPTEDKFTEHAKVKVQIKVMTGVKYSSRFTLYNNADMSMEPEPEAEQMQAEFTKGTLSLTGKQIVSGVPFDVNGAKQMTFNFVPSIHELLTIPVVFFTVTEVGDKLYSTYELELIGNRPPKAALTIRKLKSNVPREYEFDASASVDTDADMGGIIAGFKYTVIEVATNSRQPFDQQPTKKVRTYPFPSAGEFMVTLTVIDSDLDENSTTVTVKAED